jgi:hypothetical protein
MKLTGFCSAEWGIIGISGKWQNFCPHDCSLGATEGNCRDCGRDFSNYIEVDDVSVGLFSSWEICLDSGGRLGLVILEPEYTEAVVEVLQTLAIQDEWDGNYPQITLNMINAWLGSRPDDYKISHTGKLEITENLFWKEFIQDSGIVIVGESRQGIKSKAPLFTFDHFKTGEAHIFEIYGESENSTLRKKAILIASDAAVKDLDIPMNGAPRGKSYSFTVSAPPFDIPSYAIATSWINSQIKNFEIKDMNASEMPEGASQGYLDHIENLKAIWVLEFNSWAIMQKVHETEKDFESILDVELPTMNSVYREAILGFRGQ